MTCLLPILLGTALAEEPPPRAPVPPIRFLAGPVFRQDTTTGATLELGVEATGNEIVHLDFGIAFTPPHIFTLPGPGRTFASLDLLVDIGFDVGPFLTTGPTGGGAWRFFGQQGVSIDDSQTGLVGWMVSSKLLRTKRFGWFVTGRALVDTRRVDLVLATSQVRRMEPIEVRVAMGMYVGRRSTK